jgi:hypothetical protein
MVRPLSLASATLLLVSFAASAAPRKPPKAPPTKQGIRRPKVVDTVAPVRLADDAGDAAKRLSAAFAKDDRAAVVRELAVPLSYEKLRTTDEGCRRQFGIDGMVMRQKDLDAFARCILLTVEFSEDSDVIPYDRFDEDSKRVVTMIKIDPKSHKIVQITAGHHEGQAAGVVAGPR